MPAQTIVIVDDDPAIVQLLHTILSKAGYRTILVARGMDAYQVIHEQQPDLVILDLQLETPHAAGSVLNLMVADARTKTIPVIISSGDPMLLRETAGPLHSARVAALAKPFQIAELLELVRRSLMQSRRA